MFRQGPTSWFLTGLAATDMAGAVICKGSGHRHTAFKQISVIAILPLWPSVSDLAGMRGCVHASKPS